MKICSASESNYPNADQLTREPDDTDCLNSGDVEKQEKINSSIWNKHKVNFNLADRGGHSPPHRAVYLEMVRLLFERGANVKKPDVRGHPPKALAKVHENRRNEHKIDFLKPETANNPVNKRYLPTINRGLCCSSTSLTKPAVSTSASPTKEEVRKFKGRRVTIHAEFQKNASEKHLPKLTILPDSLKELIIFAGQKFGGHNLTKVVNSENAEIDDLSVVRDGDHLFLLPSDSIRGDYNVT